MFSTTAATTSSIETLAAVVTVRGRATAAAMVF